MRKDRHLEKSIGKEVEVKLFKKDNKGNKIYNGKLEEYDEGKIIIENIEIPRKDIAQIKTIYNWEEQQD